VSRPDFRRWAEALAGDRTARRVVPPSGFSAALTIVSAAAMAFLAVFAIAMALAAGGLAQRWETELAGTATVTVPGDPASLPERVGAVLKALSETPGVVSARALTADEQKALLAPWFGTDLPLDALDLPALIEVTETPAGPDAVGLKQRLAAEAPGAVYDNHDRWRAPLVAAAARLRSLALIALALIAGVTAVTIALAASAALAANGQVIDVLRLVGARDGWITGAFVRRFTARAFAGALAGTALGAAAVALIPGTSGAGILSGLGLSGAEWLWPLVVPPGAAALAWAATRIAAARRLKEAA